MSFEKSKKFSFITFLQDAEFEKGGFNVVLKSDTGGATSDDFRKHHQGSIKSHIQVECEAT